MNCLATPEAYFVDGVGDSLLLGSQQTLEAECHRALRGACLRLRRSPGPWFVTRAWVKGASRIVYSALVQSENKERKMAADDTEH